MNVPAHDGYHFNVMRRAIDLIDEADPKLSLNELAERMNMSPAHFQRVFTQWVGVSPKRYQQYLALGQAKDMLAGRFTTLDTAHELGLSGTGRLYDLFLRWEAMSPGEFARRGEGLTVYWGWFDSPFGLSLVMGTQKGICGIGFASETTEEATMEDLMSRWPKATFVEDPMMLRPWVLNAFGAGDQAEEKNPALYDWCTVSDQGLGGLAASPFGTRHDLFRKLPRRLAIPRPCGPSAQQLAATQ